MKFMNMKRFGSIVMAGALALSLTAPAFADASTPAGQVTITGSYEDIPIAVSVPTTGTAQINPYGLPVELTKSDKTTVSISGEQIVTQPLSIKNQGATALDVNASLSVVPAGDVAIQGAALTSSEKGKEIDVNLEVVGLNNSAFATVSTDPTIEDAIKDAFANDATWDNAKSLKALAAAKGASTADTAKSTATDVSNTTLVGTMAVLGAATVEGSVITYGAKSIALFRLAGEVNAEPVKAATAPATGTVDDPWAETDGFTATVVFKFTPHAMVDASISLDNGTLNVANGGTASLTASFDAGDTELTVKSWAWSTSSAVTADVTRNDAPTATVEWKQAGSATITVTATLSDNTTRTATSAVTCAS